MKKVVVSFIILAVMLMGAAIALELEKDGLALALFILSFTPSGVFSEGLEELKRTRK